MIQVREYARITTDDTAIQSLDCGVVSKATLDWLQQLSMDWKGAEPVALINGRRSIKLGSYVGYLQCPAGEDIEILPKTGYGQENPSTARKVLQNMLSTALGLKPRQSGAAELLRMRTPLHEWIFSQFLQELAELVRRGLRFDYRKIEEESRYVRGQLMLDRQQRQPPGRAHLFHIRHDIFSPNRIENRLLVTALDFVKVQCRQAENWRLANELSHLMEDITPVSNPLQELPKWQSSKLMQGYTTIRPWCELILEKLNPNFQKGAHRGISLLFPMEQLFEKYVEVCLRKSLTKGSKLRSQVSSKYFLEHQPDGLGAPQPWFQLQPDLLMFSGERSQVLDTKWKLIDQRANQSNAKYQIKQSDLYQLFAYGQKYQDGVGHMMLIYPYYNQFERALPPFNFSPDLTLWAVPFCLESKRLIPGDWQEHFPGFAPDAIATRELHYA